MTAEPTAALDLLRFLALSLEVHTDALCCAVDDVEAAIVEFSINDELMDRLEDELAVLLGRQRRMHAGQAMIALSQKERLRGNALRRDEHPPSQPWGDKRIQTSRTHSRAASTATGQWSAVRSPRQPAESEMREDFSDGASTRCLSNAEGSLEADVAAVDHRVDLLKAKIEELDCYSLRGKLLQLEKMKKAVKDIDLGRLMESVVDNFEFPPAVRTLWASGSSSSPSCASAAVGVSYASSSTLSVAAHNTSSRSITMRSSNETTLAQHAAGKGDVVNHTNVDLLLARACQRLAGRSVDALEALASTNVSEESAAAHVLGCVVYAAEFDRSDWSELRAVMELQTLPRDALARRYRRWEKQSICKASIDARCFGARCTVLAAQDFSALPADWATSQSLSRIPLDEVLQPMRHLLSPRFTFVNVAELKHLQARRVALQRKIVQFLLGGPATSEELLRQVPCSDVDRAVAAARLAVGESTPPTISGHAWKTMVRVPRKA
ncbi:hypothetical protein ABB37_03370 [Leptomonas pyrrhocoris]|uniref:Uncharacterized protein n=1 Tax=Leptomonas pyrrhocoris TaxID=157538 RepID=A0A0M9G4I2_LEPPY|nr:hypothetical protein ABB37_03370 [Leptomonas pyrrhocoris]KPA82260.1 hypothetical protein ABB37_03370 [Leptomonas pyrrhocoris]|eukprot:XP_015660699.1 hypothetical protein ABB37_03370 [Leptomonas pyrrhocoris]